jgi:hypothetical protein
LKLSADWASYRHKRLFSTRWSILDRLNRLKSSLYDQQLEDFKRHQENRNLLAKDLPLS